jgi:hypothetical protein
MENSPPPKTHRPSICKCPEAFEKEEACPCGCQRCIEAAERYHAKAAQMERCAELIARLEKAGIKVEDLTELVFITKMPALEQKIADIVDEKLRKMFNRMAFMAEWRESNGVAK